MGAGESTYAPWDGDLPANALKTLSLGVESMHRANDELLFWMQGNQYRFEMDESQQEQSDAINDMIRCMEDQRELWAKLATIVRTPFHKLPHADDSCNTCIPRYNPGTIESFLAWLCKFSHAQKIFAAETVDVQSKLQEIAQSLKPVYRKVICPKTGEVQVRRDPFWWRKVDLLNSEPPVLINEESRRLYTQPPGSLSRFQHEPKSGQYRRYALLGDRDNADQLVREGDDFEVNEVDTDVGCAGCGNDWRQFHTCDDNLIMVDSGKEEPESESSDDAQKLCEEPESEYKDIKKEPETLISQFPVPEHMEPKT